MIVEHITSWKELTEAFENTNSYKYNHQGGHIQFRGQSNESWKLDSSLKRIVSGDSISEEKALYYEVEAQAEFLSQSHLLNEKLAFDKGIYNVAINVDMQHFSCPTRMLDWSGSPYIGLYFAISENLHQDGAVFIWDVRYYDQSMKALHDGFGSIIATDIVEFKGYDFVELVLPTRKNERIVRQQGTFSISNNILKSHCDLINEAGQLTKSNVGLWKCIIPADLKLEFLSRLRSMNISSNSIFPSMDGLGRSIKENLILRRWAKR